MNRFPLDVKVSFVNEFNEYETFKLTHYIFADQNLFEARLAVKELWTKDNPEVQDIKVEVTNQEQYYTWIAPQS